MLQKKTCERCGKQYWRSTFSEKKGRYYCSDCMKKCLVCGSELPEHHKFGADVELSRYSSKIKLIPGVGSGLCIPCYLARIKKEQGEQLSIRLDRETIETPATWTCSYCKSINSGNFCFNCGSFRRSA